MKGSSQVHQSRLAIVQFNRHLRFIVACALAFCWVGQTTTHAQSSSQPLIKLGKIEPKSINESSGATRAINFKDAFWTHNDSGGRNNLYLLSLSGKHLATCPIPGARNRDWETLDGFVMDGKSYLLIGDVGDNLSKRTDCELLLVEEPKFKLKKGTIINETLKPTIIPIRFKDGPHNCEAMAVDAEQETIYLFEKRYVDDTSGKLPGIYRAKFKTDGSAITAERLSNYPIRNVTGMAIDETGTQLVVRNYLNAHLFRRKKNQTWDEVLSSPKPKVVFTPIQSQSEAIFFTEDSQSVVITSEGNQPVIWQVKLPTESTKTPKKTEKK